MKEEGLIDGAVGVAKGRDELHPLPFYARSEDEIRRLAGMRHCLRSWVSPAIQMQLER